MSATNTKDLAGIKFGKLTALRKIGRRCYPAGGAHAIWECLCECGALSHVVSAALLSSHTTSCGCIKRLEPTRLRHGHARKGKKSKMYVIWNSMKLRKAGVCERWLVFENFLADMGECPDGMEIDRKDNSVGYEPGNCRWATRTQQVRNRTNTTFVEYDGRKIPLAELAETANLKYSLVISRYQRGKRGADLIAPIVKGRGGEVVLDHKHDLIG